MGSHRLAGGLPAAPAGRAAVLGQPVAHSLSPVLHRAAYRELGLSGWRYDAVECGVDDLPGFVAGLGPEWAGMSLTMPLKRVACTVADEASPLVAEVGAANTLVRCGGRWRVENTDVGGIVDALREAGVTGPSGWSGPTGAVLLGAGGTAQAALAALRELGERHPTVLVRDPSSTGELRAAADRLGVAPVVVAGLADPVVYRAPLVISTVPRGAADVIADRAADRVDNPAADRVADRAGWARLDRPGVVFDVVYDPWPTPLARSAGRAGRRVVGGLDLLLHQAVRQVRLMTGHTDVPVAAMRAALAGAARA
ncbi:MAG TPA: shikimate dehydrogenase [Mycobacteriales bacterium]|nr:shikimate dehydrogenase [Mycobacteriales bacterium]